MIPNLRDVAASVELVADAPILAPGQLYRGGTVARLLYADDLPPVQTVVNLRRGPDPQFAGIDQIHVPAPRGVDNYRTGHHEVRRWLDRVMAALDAATWPVLVHCSFGRDRTGIVVALILAQLPLPRDQIRDEYALSDGVDDPSLIDAALDGFAARDPYLSDPTLAARITARLRTGGRG